MYYEITPTDPLSPHVQYLDGNVDTPTDIDIQLEYLDGNQGSVTLPEPIVEPSVYYADETASMELFPREWPAVHAVYNIYGQTTTRMYFDGNRDLWSNTMLHCTSGETLDGNKPSVPTKLHSDTLGYSGRNVTGDDFTWISNTEFYEHYGQSRAIINPFYLYVELVNRSTCDFDRTVEARIGKIYPDIRVHYDDPEYQVLQETYILPMIKGVGPVEYIVGQTKYWYKTKYKIMETANIGADLLIVGSDYDDGSGQVYDYNGNVVGYTNQFFEIAYNDQYTGVFKQPPTRLYIDDFYELSDQGPQISAWNPPATFENLLFTRESYSSYANYFRARLTVPEEPTTLSVTMTNITNLFSGIYVWNVTTGYTLKSKYDYNPYDKIFDIDFTDNLYDISPGDIIEINAYAGTTSYSFTADISVSLAPYREIWLNNDVYDNNMHYLFDPTLLRDRPYTNDGIYVDLDREEYRLKGPVVFGNIVKWCVLDYDRPGRYKIINTVDISDVRDLHNKDLFPAIKFNKVLTI